MATVNLDIGSRRYAVSCRDGEEEHLRALAALVDKRTQDAAEALGSLSESRLLLFTSLLLADDLQDKKDGKTVAPAEPAPVPQVDPALAEALERLAERVESLADRLEGGPRSA